MSEMTGGSPRPGGGSPDGRRWSGSECARVWKNKRRTGREVSVRMGRSL